MSPSDGATLVTGYPGFIGKRLVEHLAQQGRGGVYALVQPRFLDEARGLAARVPGAPVEVLSGDVTDLHLGLSGEEVERVAASVTRIFHLAALNQLTISREEAFRTNVEGTRNVLELARECRRLERLVHFSTCHVAGAREGVISEDELDRGQEFRNAWEESKFHAEKAVVRAMDALPVTIVRPSTVVGDSRTGEIDRFEGPYALGILLVASPLVVPLPLPGNGIAPLNVVPVDFVVQATVRLASDPRAKGRTFHLVDPSPMSVARVYELIAERANRRIPKLTFPARAAEAVLRLPLLERVTRPQRAALGYINQLAWFTSANTLELLEGTGIRCPRLSTYLDTLIAYVREDYARRQAAEAETLVEDPLDEGAKANA
ncbi:MAG: NAD-dependent epimerase/dehydratase family protein [Myxococcaceae bacterium]|nr:MAG: NAD-dependent epimerase/dehydratase family protein [Myxococcaceae bacterium]